MYKLAYVSVQATYTHWPAGHPLPGAVLKTLRRTSYTLCSLYVASEYTTVLCYNIAGTVFSNTVPARGGRPASTYT